MIKKKRLLARKLAGKCMAEHRANIGRLNDFHTAVAHIDRSAKVSGCKPTPVTAKSLSRAVKKMEGD